jgi:hypothetical protein
MDDGDFGTACYSYPRAENESRLEWKVAFTENE